MNYDDHLDALGALCPIPVLKAQKRLRNLNSGEILNILADDPARQQLIFHIFVMNKVIH